MKRKQRKKLSPFEAELLRAERRGMRVLPPGEREPTPAEADSQKLVEKYGSPDALPLEYARRALRELKLIETTDYLAFVWAFLKDRIEWQLGRTQKKYRRLRLLRGQRSSTAYRVFYAALSRYIADLPLPQEGKVIKLADIKKITQQTP